MGQKVKPIAFRAGINRNWTSVWFAGEQAYADKIKEDHAIRTFLTKKLKDAHVSKIVIERPSKKCRVFIHTSRPSPTPMAVASRRRLAATAAGSSPTWSPRLKVSNGAADAPPARVVVTRRMRAATRDVSGSRVPVSAA